MNKNIIRLLEKQKIEYQLLPLGSNEKRSAEEVAQILEVGFHLVYKSIVLLSKNPGKPILALVQSNQSVDTKKVAAALNEKKVTVTKQDEAEKLTGLQTGGISPLALINKRFCILIDKKAESLPKIIISAGELGMQIKINPMNLKNLTNARFSDISTS